MKTTLARSRPTPGARRTRLAVALVAALAAILAAACGDDALSGPDATPDLRPVELGACTNLRAPAANTLTRRLYARGVQIYRWTGTSWSFVEPSAVLYADAEGRDAVGAHYAGPTWLSASGSKVTGTVTDRCTPDASAIPWLLLGASSADAAGGKGLFQGVTVIQRVRTVGGNAPTAPGQATGELASVPYTAEYLFYR